MANTAANIANVTAKTSISTNSAPISNVETYITAPLLLISGNTSNADTFRIVVAGSRIDARRFLLHL